MNYRLCTTISLENNTEMINQVLESLKNPDSYAYAFWFSLLLLTVISMLKFLISKEAQLSDWGNLVLEIPIDVCAIIITIIFTGYMKNGNIAIGSLLVILTLIVSVLCCFFRRLSLKHSYDEGYKIQMFIYAVAELFLACGWITVFYIKII